VYESVSWEIGNGRYHLKCINEPNSTRGFYACTSQLYMSLIRLLKNGVTSIDIDMSETYRIYKKDQKYDVYRDVFKKDESILKKSKYAHRLSRLPLYEGYFHHDHYKDFDYSALNIVTRSFFSPSDQVEKREQEIIKKYKINPAKTIAVFYRGTDKSTEVKLASQESFVDFARKFLKKNRGFKILLQTDQDQVADTFTKTFKGSCVVLKELPMAAGVIAVHHSLIPDLEKYQHVITLDAIVRILSRCKYVINSTGNVACFIALYRGNTKKLFQFDSNGELIFPSFNWYKAAGLVGQYIRTRSPRLFRFLKPYFPDKK